MKCLFLLVALALTGFAFACGDGDGSTSTAPRQVAVEDLTLQEVRERAVAALLRPGQVYHSTQRTTIRGDAFTSAVWLDLERDLARVKEGEHLRIFHEGKIAELSPSGRFQDAAVWNAPGLDKSSALSLDHIATLFAVDIERTQLRAAEVDGVPAILLEVVEPYHGDYTGTETRKLYLDESFLLLKVDYHADIRGAPDLDWSVVVENEFIERGSLPEDFFSPEAVRAFEVTPVDDIARAAEAGLKPYWLGERFEDMVLEDAIETDLDGGRALHITYRGGGNGPEGPGFGVTISEYTTDDWDRQTATLQRIPWWEEPGTTGTSVVVLGTEATLYENPYIELPLNVGPEGKPSAWLLLVRLDDTVLKIEPSVGDPRSNPYVDNPEALLRLANSMQPFERPPE